MIEMSTDAPTPPKVAIRYRNGSMIDCPVKYTGWREPIPGKGLSHCWLVINEGPFDNREGDQLLVAGGTTPQYVECRGTGPK